MPQSATMSDPVTASTCQCAILTATGPGAVAVVGVLGSDIGNRLTALFRPAGTRGLSAGSSRDVRYGHWIASGEDVVVTCLDSDQAEIHCHGGATAADAIVRSLQSAGFQLRTPLDYRARLLGRWQAETESALSRTTTRRTAGILLALMDAQPEIHQQLGDRIRVAEFESSKQMVDRMLDWAEFGRCLIEPRSVVLCGQPNVGKSSLINALVGFQRSIVHDQAGTTRDVVSHRTAIDGWPVELKDTAGLRTSQNRIEALGVDRARQEIRRAHVRLAIFDGTSPWSADDTLLVNSIQPDVIVFNKSDLAVGRHEPPDRDSGLSVSALTGDGLRALLSAVSDRLIPALPPAGQWYPVTTWQHDQLTLLRQRLDQRDRDAALALLNAEV